MSIIQETMLFQYRRNHSTPAPFRFEVGFESESNPGGAGTSPGPGLEWWHQLGVHFAQSLLFGTILEEEEEEEEEDEDFEFDDEDWDGDSDSGLDISHFGLVTDQDDLVGREAFVEAGEAVSTSQRRSKRTATTGTSADSSSNPTASGRRTARSASQSKSKSKRGERERTSSSADVMETASSRSLDNTNNATIKRSKRKQAETATASCSHRNDKRRK